MHKLIQLLILGVIVGSGLGRVQALHRDDLPTVVSLAHQLQAKVHHVHHYAEENQHHFNWWEKRMLQALHHCDQDATRFHQTIENFFAHPDEVMHTWEHFLHYANTANQYVHRSHTMGHVRHDWQHCVTLIQQIHHLLDEDGGHHPVAGLGGGVPAANPQVANFETLHAKSAD